MGASGSRSGALGIAGLKAYWLAHQNMLPDWKLGVPGSWCCEQRIG